MAAKDTDVYREAVALLKVIIEVHRNLPRDLKPVLGAEMLKECTQMILNIGRANSTWISLQDPAERREAIKRRRGYIKSVNEKSEVVAMTCQVLCSDLKEITPDKFAEISVIAGSIGRQSYKWWKSTV